MDRKTDEDSPVRGSYSLRTKVAAVVEAGGTETVAATAADALEEIRLAAATGTVPVVVDVRVGC